MWLKASPLDAILAQMCDILIAPQVGDIWTRRWRTFTLFLRSLTVFLGSCCGCWLSPGSWDTSEAGSGAPSDPTCMPPGPSVAAWVRLTGRALRFIRKGHLVSLAFSRRRRQPKQRHQDLLGGAPTRQRRTNTPAA